MAEEMKDGGEFPSDGRVGGARGSLWTVGYGLLSCQKIEQPDPYAGRALIIEMTPTTLITRLML
jgi:hypothetical protein